jgi:hypothetical protein
MPEKIGLTDEEWIEYFTLHECAELYEALESKGLIAERYNYISEEFIKRSRRYDLVLARNHPDALPWFRDFALNKSEDHNIYEIHQLILTYFEPSIKPVTKASDFEQYKLDVREWFLAQKNEDFRFDSKKQKYILTPKP